MKNEQNTQIDTPDKCSQTFGKAGMKVEKALSTNEETGRALKISSKRKQYTMLRKMTFSRSRRAIVYVT